MQISGRRRITEIASPIIGHYLSLLEFPLSCSLDYGGARPRRGAKSSRLHTHGATIYPHQPVYFVIAQTLLIYRLIVYSNSLFSSSACVCVCTRAHTSVCIEPGGRGAREISPLRFSCFRNKSKIERRGILYMPHVLYVYIYIYTHTSVGYARSRYIR